MARSHACSLLATVVALLPGGGCTAPASAQNRAEPAHLTASPAALTAPRVKPPAPPAVVVVPPPAAPVNRLWPFKRLYNVDYVDARAIAERYGLKAAWVASGRVMELVDEHGRVRLKFEDRNHDFFLDGVRVFMGESTIFNKGSLYVSKIDVIKTVAPLLRPADRADLLPHPPRLIVLDPGHGGNDPGNQNSVLRVDEKDMTLDVALRLKKVLEARGYAVLLTRTGDRRVELEQRAEIAGRAKADLFLSIHFNALPPAVAGRVTGSETYVLTPQFQPSTQPEKDKAMIPVLYPGNRLDYANAVLGYCLHRLLLTELKTPDRGYKRARWVVLRFAECPAALIEAAFLSNNVEARRVATPEYRQQIAQAIASGIDAYAATLAAAQPPAAVPAETRSPIAASR